MLAAMREHTITGWAELESELDAWRASGICATFWWRDDDATRPGPRLDRLIETAAGVPISLAVIPAKVTEALAGWMRTQDDVIALQHGYAHINHAPTGTKKTEFGDDRLVTEMLAEIGRGRARMVSLFGDRFLPIFVPPWNRVSAGLAGPLKSEGFLGLSAFGPRHMETEISTLNCHADPIAWRGSRGFVGEDSILAQITGHLAARRSGVVDPMEATGLMTHHRDHDAAGWQFLSDFARVISEHPAARWISADMALASTQR